MDNNIVKENKEIEKQLTEYFQRKYDSNSTFMFSHIGYTYKYFGERSILDLNNGGKVKKIQEDIIDRSLAHIPILVPNDKDMSYGQFMELNSCLKIDEIIDLDTDEETIKNKLLDAIRGVLPPEVIIIDDNQLDNALKDLGYTTYKFNFESLGTLGDGRIVTEFEGDVECDYTTFPKNVTDKETADILDELYSKHKLKFKLKKYGVGSQDKPIHITDCFEEYTFEGKKYIRVSSDISSELKLSNGDEIDPQKPYWIEVEEIGKDEKVYAIHDISEIQEIIPERRQGEVYKTLSEFLNDNKEKEEQTKVD